MNLKDKLNKMSSRLGPPQKNQDEPQQMNNSEININRPHKRSSYRPSFKRSYSRLVKKTVVFKKKNYYIKFNSMLFLINGILKPFFFLQIN